MSKQTNLLPFTGNPGIKKIPLIRKMFQKYFLDTFFFQILYDETNNKINNPMAQLPFEHRVCQLTTGLSSIFPQTDMKVHPASLWVMCDQHIISPAVGFVNWDYSDCLNSSRSHTLAKIPPPQVSNQHTS